MVRDLVGTVQRENADLGVLISLVDATGPMLKEAVAAGFYTSPMGGKHPKIQILTIEDLLGGKGIDYPSQYQRANVTFKRAPKAQNASTDAGLFDEVVEEFIPSSKDASS